MPKKQPRQLELFAATYRGSEQEIHALGLLGWRDPLWSRKIEIEMQDGEKLIITLATIRQLQRCAALASPSARNAKRSPYEAAGTTETL